MCGRGCFKINNEEVSITSFTESRAVPVASVIVTRDPQAWSRAARRRTRVEGQADAPAFCSVSMAPLGQCRIEWVMCGDLRTLRKPASTGNYSLSSGQVWFLHSVKEWEADNRITNKPLYIMDSQHRRALVCLCHRRWPRCFLYLPLKGNQNQEVLFGE